MAFYPVVGSVFMSVFHSSGSDRLQIHRLQNKLTALSLTIHLEPEYVILHISITVQREIVFYGHVLFIEALY